MPWVLWIADLVKHINQGVLAVGPNRNVDVDRGAGGGVTQSLPVGRGGVPHVLHTHVTPKSCKRRREVPEGSGSKHEENREQVVAHG